MRIVQSSHPADTTSENNGEIGSFLRPILRSSGHLATMEPGYWPGRSMEAQCPERAVDPDSEDFCRPEQEQALLSIPATPQKKKNFSPETIAAAVSECVDKKMSVAVVATKYEVCYSTIRKWVKRSGKTLPSRHATTPKKPDNPSILNFFSPTKKPNPTSEHATP